jgi:hypothetical protein
MLSEISRCLRWAFYVQCVVHEYDSYSCFVYIRRRPTHGGELVIWSPTSCIHFVNLSGDMITVSNLYLYIITMNYIHFLLTEQV